jgi:hypothetical protein
MRALRVCAFCVVGVAAATLVCAYLIAAESQPAPAKTPDLQQRVTALEETVAQLEKKLDQISAGYLRTVPPGVALPHGSPRFLTAPQATPDAPLVAPSQAPPGIPPNAVPHVFNGQTYYILPLTK